MGAGCPAGGKHVRSRAVRVCEAGCGAPAARAIARVGSYPGVRRARVAAPRARGEGGGMEGYAHMPAQQGPHGRPQHVAAHRAVEILLLAPAAAGAAARARLFGHGSAAASGAGIRPGAAVSACPAPRRSQGGARVWVPPPPAPWAGRVSVVTPGPARGIVVAQAQWAAPRRKGRAGLVQAMAIMCRPPPPRVSRCCQDSAWAVAGAGRPLLCETRGPSWAWCSPVARSPILSVLPATGEGRDPAAHAGESWVATSYKVCAFSWSTFIVDGSFLRCDSYLACVTGMQIIAQLTR